MATQSASMDGHGLVLRGVITVLFGAAAAFWPDVTLRTVVFLFSAFILASGIVQLITGVGGLFHGTQSVLTRVVKVLWGALEIGVGVYLLRHTFVRLSVFILVVGFTLLVRGLVEVLVGLFDEGPSGNRILLIIIGLLTALAGIIMLFQPVASGIAFVWILGVYALVTGPLMIALGMQAEKVEAAAATSRKK